MSKEIMEFGFELKQDSITDDGVFEGYASTFGGEPDSYGDIVMPGAFSKTLAEGGKTGFGVAMLWQHDSRKPLGVWLSLIEDKKGLAVQGQLARTQLGQEARELMKMGALKGLSFGYDVIDSAREINDDDQRIRYLKELALWEVSPVTFPANTRSNITVVKAIEEASTERELETALREAGLSKKTAQYVVTLCKPSLRESGKADGSLSAVLTALQIANIESKLLSTKTF